MRFYPLCMFLVALIIVLSIAPVSLASAQASNPGPRVAGTDALPDAHEPRTTASTVESGAEEAVAGQDESKPVVDPSAADISGTVTDTNGNVVPGAVTALEGADISNRQTTVADDSGAFHFGSLKAGSPYHITVEAKGFEIWKSPPLILNTGQHLQLQDIELKLPATVTSVVVYANPEEIATQQVIVEEHQRVLGIFPNFYTTYDTDPVPLSTKLKFRLAFKADTDLMTFVGVAFISAIYQAGDIPDYGQGWDAYGKRMAAGYADTTTDVFIGGAILPWLLHQDPRYFYQGTGTKRSRARHAILSPFVCKGDNGKMQPNYSSMVGDLASGSISNFYYPQSNRGAALLFQGFLVTTGVRIANGLAQEFVFRKLTPSARR